MAVKRKVSKEELRKAMSEAKKKHSVIKRIESPLARYNELDQLVCVICKLVVRSEAVWPVHLNSKSHKDNVVLAKAGKLKSSLAIQPQSNKRPSTFKEPQEPKRIKGILKNAGQPQSNVKANLPADFFDDSKSSTVTSSASQASKVNGQIDKVETITSELTKAEIDEDKESKDVNSASLPEGFFDDPIMDAKARNVVYKDPIEEEWEKFQKEIKEETEQSAQIIGEDQEEAATERQLDVIEEQLRNWSRVMDLVKQKELVQTTEKIQENNESSSDDEDFDEYLDWRAKKSYQK